MLHVVQPIVVALAKKFAVNRRDFSAVRKLFSGAAPLGADVIRQCKARVGAVVSKVTASPRQAHVTSYKKVRRLDFIDAIPKSPSGKILKRLLRELQA